MALIKYSALVSGMSGKLNGSVAARNKGGNYLRNKTTPVNPQSSAQQFARAQFGGVSSLFRTLDDEAVNSWNSGAANFPYTNIFGDVSYLNGLQLFTKLNTNRAIAGETFLTNCPAAEGPGSVVLTSAQYSVGAREISLSFTSETAALNNVFVLDGTAQLSGNSRFYKNRFRQILVGDNTMMSNASAIATAYQNAFGDVAAGANIAFRLSQINAATGERSVGSVVKAVVLA